MKNLVVVCLGVLVVVTAAVPAYSQDKDVSPFVRVKRIGEPPAQMFFQFSTSVSNYTIRNDGMGEVPGRIRKKDFHLKVGSKSFIERLYFFEYQGDLILLYEAGAAGYLVRLNQKTTTIRSTTAIKENFEPPLLKEQTLTFTDGTVVPLN